MMNMRMNADVNRANSNRRTLMRGGREALDRILAGIARQKAPALSSLPIDNARLMYSAAMRVLDIARCDEVRVVPRVIEVAGRAINVRINDPGTQSNARVLVWVHGGGFCLGDAAATDAVCSRIASWTSATVVSVDYRLAPEHPLPGALDDVVAALRWVRFTWPLANVQLAGESAGATLALAAATQVHEEGGCEVEALALCYPLVDGFVPTLSRKTYERGHFLTVADLEWMLNTAGFPAGDARLTRTPASSLPRTWLFVADRDPLRDEALRLHEMLIEAGCAIDLIEHEDMVHGCMYMGGAVGAVQQIHQSLVRFLVPGIDNATS